MQVIKEEGSRPIKAWVGTKNSGSFNWEEPSLVPDIEDSAMQQLKKLAKMPFIAPNGVAVMPDVHAGIGSTVGSVIATDKAIIPAAVGVDIGCGMNAVRLSLKASDLPDSLLAVRHQIERDVPMGNSSHTRAEDVDANRRRLPIADDVRGRMAVSSAVGGWYQAESKAASQLGTLGSGNHFIELCLDENQNVWIMLHSGSRGIGNMIGRHYIAKAKRSMEQFFIKLPDGDLAYFPEDTDDFEDYTRAVQWAQDYALENRKVMMTAVIAALRLHIPVPFEVTTEAINCHHNYVEKENHFGRNLWVTRKGAIRAREGDLGIIPGSMGQQSYIVRGKGNPESYCSCSHGAGRVMSRTEAKRRFSLQDLVAQTEGVECRKDADVIDEIPGAYKRLDVVMENQKDLVEVVHTLRAVLCCKGS
jgi:tRNA-splicing ligase RtcB